MTTDIELQSSPETFARSTLWDIVVPMFIVAVPSSSFLLLRFVTDGLDRPGAIAPLPVIVTMVSLEAIGIVAMAFVILTKFEGAFRRLSFLTNGQPQVWRRLALLLSIACLLLCDVLTNVSAAFAGAGFLLVVAVPAFVTYIVCKRVAFTCLSARIAQ
jgi:hypothetical protein